MSVVLSINNQEIDEATLLKELDEIKKKLSQDQSFSLNDQMESITLKYAKENIINRVLLEQEAEKSIESIDYQEIKTEFQKILDHYGDWEAMQEYFSDIEITPFQIKANIEKSLKVEKLLKLWAAEIDPPNEGELMSFYNNNSDKFFSPEKILLSKFFLPNARDEKINHLLMENLLNYYTTAKDYKDFLDKALQIPKLVYEEKFLLTKNQLQIEVEEVLMNLSDEEMSGIIQTSDGLYLFKRWSKIPPQSLDYDDARPSIEKILFAEKKSKRIKENLLQLKKQSIIEDFFTL